TLKLTSGSDGCDVEELARQAEEYDAGGAVAGSMVRLLRLMGQTHPLPVLRLAELRKWIRSGAYQEILDGRYATGVPDEIPAANAAYLRLAATQETLLTAARGVSARAQALGRTVLGALRPAKAKTKPPRRAPAK